MRTCHGHFRYIPNVSKPELYSSALIFPNVWQNTNNCPALLPNILHKAVHTVFGMTAITVRADYNCQVLNLHIAKAPWSLQQHFDVPEWLTADDKTGTNRAVNFQHKALIWIQEGTKYRKQTYNATPNSITTLKFTLYKIQQQFGSTEYCQRTSSHKARHVTGLRMIYASVSQPPRRGPVPGINYTGPREVLLEFVILVF